MKNIIRTIWAVIKFAIFFAWVLIQVPVAIILIPFGWRAGVAHLRVFMRVMLFLAGIRVRVHGKLSAARPLLVIGNHISIFELATFPCAFGGSFFGKQEIADFPLVGWLVKRFGVIFVDRRPARVQTALANVRDAMTRAKWPMFLFPEGTTTSGTYVLPFKSSLFNILEGGANITVQPVVQFYRYKNGAPIPDQILADDYAYFANAKMTQPPYAKLERNWIAQLFHIFKLGGFLVEIYVLPVPPLGGMDRKQAAEALHKTVNEKFNELKNGSKK